MDSWQEFSELLVKLTPSFMKQIFRNKPLFYKVIAVAICIELVVVYFICVKAFSQ